MESKNILVSLVATFALVLLVSANVTAVDVFGNITSVTVNDVELSDGQTLAVQAGETLDIRVVFVASHYEADVEMFARIRGTGSISDSTERLDVLANRTYTKTLRVKIPSNIDRAENMILLIGVESQDGVGGHREIRLLAQRGSYSVQILSITNLDQVNAGDNLALNVVLNNNGFHTAENNYVRASIAELGISNTVFFGDLVADDKENRWDDTNKQDSAERTVYLAIPRNVPAGVYNLEVEAFNADSSVVQTKRIVVGSNSANDQVISSSTSKTFAVNEKKTYSITLVNTGNGIKVYDLTIDAPRGLTVNAEDSVIVVPAGSSKTVNLDVMASENGNYDFTVSVKSDGQLVSQKSFSAIVEGSKTIGVNASVVLTVVLAIIFIVLVIVLIVLLTRKPAKTEEFGESYY